MITRRRLLKTAALGAVATVGFASYAVAYEPRVALAVRTYRPAPAQWPPALRLRAAVVSDIHVCDPWMPLSRVSEIVALTNSLKPDIVFLTGDFVAGIAPALREADVPARAWAAVLAGLEAPLGRFAVLGNHDWWHDEAAQLRGGGPTVAGEVLEAVGIPVLHNAARRVETPAGAFWVAGLGDQIALLKGIAGRQHQRGLDDLPATLAAVDTDDPVILLAHEPDIFPKVPSRVALTLSGHTHGGQIRLFGWAPVVPSAYGDRYAYGHVVEEGRHLIVSGGLGCSIAPVRIGATPEVVMVELGETAPAAAA